MKEGQQGGNMQQTDPALVDRTEPKQQEDDRTSKEVVKDLLKRPTHEHPEEPSILARRNPSPEEVKTAEVRLSIALHERKKLIAAMKVGEMPGHDVGEPPTLEDFLSPPPTEAEEEGEISE